MYSVTWIGICGELHCVSTPKRDTAMSMFVAFKDKGITCRLWVTVNKGQPLLMR